MTRSCAVARIQTPNLPYFRNSQKPPMMARRQRRDQDAIPGILQIEQREVAADRLRDAARRPGRTAKRVILQHQRNAESGKDGVERIAADQRPQRHDLQRRAEKRDDQRRGDQRQPEAAGRGDDDEADIGAEHEQFAMREIDHVHDAEDQRQSGRDQRQDHAGDDAVHRLDDEQIERNGVEELTDRVHRSDPQILFDDGMVDVDLGGGAMVAHAAFLHDIDALARLERQRHVLLDQKNGDAFVVQTAR